MKLVKKILIVGQTPPPYHGQAISTQSLLSGKYNRIKLYHVRLGFSMNISQVGKVNAFKIFHLFRVVASIYWYKFRYGINSIYFMPVGNKKVPFYRDLIILISTRWLFIETIFHFRVGGLLNFYLTLSGLNKYLFEKIYFEPELAIKLSENGMKNEECLNAKKIRVVPNGIKDYAKAFTTENVLKSEIPTVLYIGIISKSKGIYTLLDIARILKKKQLSVHFRIAGEFADQHTEKDVLQKVNEYNLNEIIQFLGQKLEDEKWIELLKAHIFCFPSYHETFGRVILEAMQFKLPVVASDTGGIPSIIKNMESGFLVPVDQADIFAEKITQLILNKDMRVKMGEKGREIFLGNFTEEIFHRRIENVLYGE